MKNSAATGSFVARASRTHALGESGVCDVSPGTEPSSPAERLMADATCALNGHFRTSQTQTRGLTPWLSTSPGTMKPSCGRTMRAAPDELLAVLAAGQRYLVEEEARDSVRGATYLDKARTRVTCRLAIREPMSIIVFN